jgi:hypothetical protein
VGYFALEAGDAGSSPVVGFIQHVAEMVQRQKPCRLFPVDKKRQFCSAGILPAVMWASCPHREAHAVTCEYSCVDSTRSCEGETPSVQRARCPTYDGHYARFTVANITVFGRW